MHIVSGAESKMREEVWRVPLRCRCGRLQHTRTAAMHMGKGGNSMLAETCNAVTRNVR